MGVTVAASAATSNIADTESKSVGPSSTLSRVDRSNQDNRDRKFNIVVYGIDEIQAGTDKLHRQELELEKVSEVLVQAEPTFDVQSIHDHFRLGKYSRSREKPRPLLVKLTRTSDVTKLLLKHDNVGPPIRIKPDLPPSERARLNALLNVRWSLMQSGIDKKDIKIRGNSLHVRNILYASFRNGQVVRQPEQNEQRIETFSLAESSPAESSVLNGPTASSHGDDGGGNST